VDIKQPETSEFHYLDELYSDELVFVLSFVSSSNTDIETAKQFMLLYTRYVCDFSGLTNFSQKLWKLKENWTKHLYRALLSWRSFLFSSHNEFSMLSTERSFASQSRVRLLIPKVNYQTVHLEKLFSWPSVCLLLASENVLNFFICEDCWLPLCAFGVSWRLN